jgi:DNA-binding GntR family transcriptional regulator
VTTLCAPLCDPGGADFRVRQAMLVFARRSQHLFATMTAPNLVTALPLARATSASAVHAELRRAILSLELLPGAILDERHLGERFGISRSPVREAMIRLAAERLVETSANRTATVSRFDIADLPGYFDARDFVYRLGARLAASNATDQQVAAIEAICRAGQESVDIAAYVSINRDFHIAIADAGGNRWLSQWTRGLLDKGQRILGLYLLDRIMAPDTGRDGTGDHHQLMFEAIAARDLQAADAAASADSEQLSIDLARWLTKRRLADFAFEAAAR